MRGWLGWGLVGLVGVLVLGVLGGYRVNLSASVPRGLYGLVPVPATLTYDQLVVLPVPPLLQPFHSRWLPLLKPVAGLAGDRVCRCGDMLLINGDSFGPVLHTSQGREVPTILREGACLTVPGGSVFLASHAPTASTVATTGR